MEDKLAIFVITLTLIVSVMGQTKNLYSDIEKWKNKYPDCGGSRQSPIDITDSVTEYDSSLRKPAWKITSEPTGEFEMFNSGKTIEVGIPNSNVVLIVDGNEYTLTQYHVHWASSERERGSEHKVNGISYEIEVHFVHYKTEYGNLTEALKKKDGITVMGFLFSEGKARNNEMIEKLFVSDFDRIKNVGSKTKIKAFDVPATMKVLANLDEIVQYDGSLTTPNCNEVVTWFMHTRPIMISREMLNKIKAIQIDEESNKNYREPQPLNGRKLRKNFMGTVSKATHTPFNVLFTLPITMAVVIIKSLF